jgi:hypothetical protein
MCELLEFCATPSGSDGEHCDDVDCNILLVLICHVVGSDPGRYTHGESRTVRNMEVSDSLDNTSNNQCRVHFSTRPSARTKPSLRRLKCPTDTLPTSTPLKGGAGRNLRSKNNNQYTSSNLRPASPHVESRASWHADGYREHRQRVASCTPRHTGNFLAISSSTPGWRYTPYVAGLHEFLKSLQG